ncbi:3-carboxy-cis,cis-muconate cycloisomerase [Stella humosa]|uniref:3-carboxy-cis,cis-muconate cycloisomerase n=1 Tax=Stella humosa TaxID=94 RepID=A0A3N1ML44_9PROT|nr:3-carboxy-cis,cis-muconate cycloisomerase [Stella humosa]ROQ01716.1 3-carboxy-cis,cis-muconate cycloisomerase [Stella humosa]BBK32098.1 3-carboxy-cis,cis-muconate cycloisomerase [Stella humosa]
MPASIIDSSILGNLFSTEAMRAIFSDETRTAKYLEVEAALARVQGRLGLIPAAAAAEIERNCRIDRIDLERLRQQTERAGSPVIGLVQQLVELCVDGQGEYCHWGATTQDITDTATVLQLREALDLVEGDLRGLSASLADLARRHRDTPVIGRSNLQQAVPVTFGYKMAGLLSAVERHRRRLDELRPRLLVGQFAGAAGTLASLPEGGLETQRLLMVELGLGQPDIAWHTQRDAIAEVGCFLGLVGGTLGKFATDVKLMMQTEVAEVYEPFAHGRGSSSTMPQKRNPVSCIYIHAAVAAARPQVTALLEAVVAEHERSAGPWQIEWAALPQICCLMAGALAHARFLAAGLEVDVPRMRANLDLTHGLVVSEAVMMGLAPHLGRERAHHLVYDLCRTAIAGGRPLVELLAETPEVADHLDRPALDRLCDPANYLGLAGAMVDRVLARLADC